MKNMSFNLMVVFFLIIIFGVSCANTGKDMKLKDKFAVFIVEVDFPSKVILDFSVIKSKLANIPIITSDDIEYYDLSSHKVWLKHKVREKIRNLDVGVVGQQFVVCVGSKYIYQGVFCSTSSSIPSDNVIIVTDYFFEDDYIKIKLGYPEREEYTGNDPRSNELIIKSLKKYKKVKLSSISNHIQNNNSIKNNLDDGKPFNENNIGKERL